MAEFVYNGVYYYLSGIMEQNYFDEILKKFISKMYGGLMKN